LLVAQHPGELGRADRGAELEAEERLAQRREAFVQVRGERRQAAAQLGWERVEAGAVQERRIAEAIPRARDLEIGQRVRQRLVFLSVERLEVGQRALDVRVLLERP